MMLIQYMKSMPTEQKTRRPTSKMTWIWKGAPRRKHCPIQTQRMTGELRVKRSDLVNHSAKGLQKMRMKEILTAKTMPTPTLM